MRACPCPRATRGPNRSSPDADAPITARVLESGGVVLGSTVMPDWGMLSSGVSSRHGITRSPWNSGLDDGRFQLRRGLPRPPGDTGRCTSAPTSADRSGCRAPGWDLPHSNPATGGSRWTAPYQGRCAGPLTRTVGGRRPAHAGPWKPTGSPGLVEPAAAGHRLSRPWTSRSVDCAWGCRWTPGAGSRPTRRPSPRCGRAAEVFEAAGAASWSRSSRS